MGQKYFFQVLPQISDHKVNPFTCIASSDEEAASKAAIHFQDQPILFDCEWTVVNVATGKKIVASAVKKYLPSDETT